MAAISLHNLPYLRSRRRGCGVGVVIPWPANFVEESPLLIYALGRDNPVTNNTRTEV